MRRLPAFLTSRWRLAARYASGTRGRSTPAAGSGPMGSPPTRRRRARIEVRGPESSAAPLTRHGPVRVAADGRHFEHEDGTPFLWLGDTWWHALSPRISDEELRELADQRVGPGVHAVQLVVGPLPEVRECEPRGRDGRRLRLGAGLDALRPEFFDAADRRIATILATRGWCPSSWAPGDITSTTPGVDVMRPTGASWSRGTRPIRWCGSSLARRRCPGTTGCSCPRRRRHAARLAAGWAEVAADDARPRRLPTGRSPSTPARGWTRTPRSMSSPTRASPTSRCSRPGIGTGAACRARMDTLARIGRAGAGPAGRQRRGLLRGDHGRLVARHPAVPVVGPGAARARRATPTARRACGA